MLILKTTTSALESLSSNSSKPPEILMKETWSKAQGLYSHGPFHGTDFHDSHDTKIKSTTPIYHQVYHNGVKMVSDFIACAVF